MKKLLIGCLMVMIGCSDTVVPIATKNGKIGYAIDCDWGSARDCGGDAFMYCPSGYQVLFGSDGKSRKIVVECIERQ